MLIVLCVVKRNTIFQTQQHPMQICVGGSVSGGESTSLFHPFFSTEKNKFDWKMRHDFIV